MCSGMVCGVTTLVLGAALVIASSIVGFLVIPGIVENGIINEVILLNDTEQLERFKQLPMPLSFSIRLFNISNAEEVLEGAVPELTEVGPYTYKMYHGREVEGMEEDVLRYRLLSRFEFDPEASFPYSDDDLVHVTNIAYHGVLQAASELVPGLMPLLNLAMDGIFGDRNAPIAAIRVGDLLFDGIKLCEGPGIVGGLACGIIRDLSESVQNMAVQEDNSIDFSVMGYRNNKPGSLMEVARGIEDHFNLGRITALNGLPELLYWAGADDNMTGSPTVCNMINGTDSGIFHPFIDTEEPLYALNTDIC
ncbi:sensory neuron membrane protein 2-like, partial [Ostrinia furnacalis]|uniref:sensory neuron membrane protein 2-like n=1 Tax=Ostrinia furnacalis TaxID=93504 RepID=UPI00103D4FFE